MKQNSSGRSSQQQSRGSHLVEDALSLAKLVGLRRRAFSSREFEAIGSAVADFAASLEDYPWVRDQVDAISQSVETVTDYARNADMETVLRDTADFARRRPVATFFAAVAGGALAARLAWPESDSGTSRGSRGSRGASSKRGKNKSGRRASAKRARSSESRANA